MTVVGAAPLWGPAPGGHSRARVVDEQQGAPYLVVMDPMGLFSAPGASVRSEYGVGALMSWVDKLWIMTYLAEGNLGAGAGLFSLSRSRVLQSERTINGCYANRLLHHETNQIFIGPYCIDSTGLIRDIPTFTNNVTHRITATARHLSDPARKVYMLTMAGLLFEVDVTTLVATQISNVATALNITGQPHFKAAYTPPVSSSPRLYVCNNTDTPNGRLAMWDGTTWTKINDSAGWIGLGGAGGSDIFAIGIDGHPSGPLSVLFYLIGNDGMGTFRKLRLPLSTQTYNNYIQQEWMRIREVESERLLLDAYGTFYELGVQTLGAGAAPLSVPRIQPICSHLRVVPDFTVFDGALVLGGNHLVNGGGSGTDYPDAGQPQAGLAFTSIDDLWSWGPRKGIGYWCKNTAFAAGALTDPMLMGGYDKKSLQLKNNGSLAIQVRVLVTSGAGGPTDEVYDDFTVPSGKYMHYEFPYGFSSSWIRLSMVTAVESLTAWMWYA